MDRTKFHIVLATKLAGVPHNLRIETTAETESKAINNAMYLLRKYGHDVFNVPKRAFKPHLDRFVTARMQRPDEAVLVIQDLEDECWIKSINLRAFVKQGEPA